jgi:electron transfer flavoprotein beta subunit
MKLLVCISNVPDTTTKIRFKDNNTQFDDTGVQWVINPWDELALTRAVELKEDGNSPVDQVHVVNVGTKITEPTLRKCLAIGADKAFRIDFDPKDSYSTAVQLAEFIKDKDYSFVITGISSSDYNDSSVGGMIAEFADLPSISSVSNIKFDNNEAVIERDVAAGKEYMTASGTVVLIVQKGFAIEPKIPNMRGIMTARSKPLEVVDAVNVESLVEFVNYKLPEPKSKVTMIDSDNIQELIKLLSTEAKVL